MGLGSVGVKEQTLEGLPKVSSLPSRKAISQPGSDLLFGNAPEKFFSG